jgi:hypothetical protein
MQITVTVSGTGVTPTGTVQINGLSNYFQNSGTLANGTYSFSVSPRQLLPGADTLTVAYEGDGTYVPVTATTMVTVSKATLPVTATPSATSIYTNTMLTISGSVGTTQYPSGSVTASSGGSVVGSGCVYCGALDYGLFSIRIQPGSLSVGTDTLTVAYSGDDFYNPASTTLTVTVAQWTKVAPTITVTPQSNSIDTGQSFSVQGTVSGSYGAPTGSVTLTSGGSTWGPASVYSDGTYSLYLSQNQLSAGSDTLTANYTGDATYLASSGSAVVTVTQSVFSISASATSPASIPKGSSASLTITISTSTNYSGKVSLTCAKTGGPTNQSGDDPGISLPSGYTGLPEIETVTVTTVAATSSALVRPPVSGGNRGLAGAAALALLILFWIPGRRRNWRQMLGVLVLLVATFGVSSCGGSGSGSGSGGGSGGGGNPGTATGTYTYTVTATGNPAVTPAPTTTFTVTVN